MTPEQLLIESTNAGGSVVDAARLYITAVTGDRWKGQNQLPAAPLDVAWDPTVRVNVTPVDATTIAPAPTSPYTFVVPFELLAGAFTITGSGAWTGTVSGGGISGEWLTNNGADWDADGRLIVSLDSSKVEGAGYWRAEIAAIATITCASPTAPILLEAFSPIAIEYEYDVDQTPAFPEAAPVQVGVRSVQVIDANTAAMQVGFRFIAPSDPGISCTAITGEVILQPYMLQKGQSKE